MSLRNQSRVKVLANTNKFKSTILLVNRFLKFAINIQINLIKQMVYKYINPIKSSLTSKGHILSTKFMRTMIHSHHALNSSKSIREQSNVTQNKISTLLKNKMIAQSKRSREFQKKKRHYQHKMALEPTRIKRCIFLNLNRWLTANQRTKDHLQTLKTKTNHLLIVPSWRPQSSLKCKMESEVTQFWGKMLRVRQTSFRRVIEPPVVMSKRSWQRSQMEHTI